MNTNRLKLAVVGGMLSALAFAVPAGAQEAAQVRVLHASPDAPAVDIYIDDAAVEGWTNVPFGTLSEYMSVPAGEYNVKVYPAGDTTSAVIDADVTVDASMSYTVAATGLLADIAPAVLTDNPTLTDDQALVRVVHFGPDAPAVDIAPDGADALISDLAFPNDTGYAALDPGTYDLEVRLAGADDVALQLDPVDLEAGGAYTVFAIGSAAAEPAGGNALTALVAMDGMILPDTATGADAAIVGGTSWSMIALLLAVGVAAFAIAYRYSFAFSRR